jgi:hypothetical protein
MPRRIASYTAKEWLKLRPLGESYKSLLLDRADRRYSRSAPPDPAALEATLQALKGRNLIATVAFNSVWVIGWQLRFAARNVENAAFVVFDNSTQAEARTQIEALCKARGVAYVALPQNPYSATRHASRSHGLALNWIWRNVIRRLAPQAWGFFDHDLFATRPFDPVARLRGQPFYGDLESRPGGAYLWPGFCLFSESLGADVALDFRQDWFLGLDTGGMNARVLAAAADLEALTFARRRSIGPARNLAVTIDEIDWFDDCVHLGNASGWYRPNEDREPALDRLLEDILNGVWAGPHAG